MLTFWQCHKSRDAEERKLALVWLLTTTPISGFDPYQYAADCLGNLIWFSHYGDQFSPVGWHLDLYPLPQMAGGTDDVPNLRALRGTANTQWGGLADPQSAQAIKR